MDSPKTQDSEPTTSMPNLVKLGKKRNLDGLQKELFTPEPSKNPRRQVLKSLFDQFNKE
ncbi:hypothetical protein RchiOBHm_Chr2g0112581 [Rosa chinensis]|uniref:Uncharacterized protein n=1 Tax=Rosa chinensis TaxID=74649 RepID=A0A2P6RQA1_ROSCH|nr:hypothetical protein RchiOBHm_Chr2g0112581 [Rosa chinensis]